MRNLNLTISEILAIPSLSISVKSDSPLPVQNIRGICTDSRTIEKGELFIAIQGELFDGHNFIQQVVDKDALACVVSHDWYERYGKDYANSNFLIVSDTLITYQEIAHYYRKKFNIPVVAITGSSGKTTTKEFIASVLAQKYKVLSNIKSFNNHIGVPATLLNLRAEHEILVTELGTNHFGELERLSYLVEPSICVFTNIGYAHLEFFKDKMGVAKAKMEMLSYMQKDGVVIYNADDPVLAALKYPDVKLFTYGTVENADVEGQVVDCDESAQYRFKMQEQSVQLSVPGRHNVLNALAATAVGAQFDVAPELIKNGLEAFDFVEKRMDVVQVNNIRIIDDTYNANPGSCAAAIDTLKDMNAKAGGKRIAILADMLELGEFSADEHIRLIEYARQNNIDALFLYGIEMEKAFKATDKDAFDYLEHFKEKQDLIKALMHYITDKDIILVKGSRSMHMEEIVEKLKSIEEV